MAFTEHQRKQWALAQERSQLDDLQGTLEILKKLVGEIPESAVLNATFANTLKAVNDIESAIEHFQTAVKLAPTSELYSLGLFHLFWSQGRQDEAFDEMRRFETISESAEYKKIVAGINAHWPRGA
jgi:predicted Zn-dependent protease